MGFLRSLLAWVACAALACSSATAQVAMIGCCELTLGSSVTAGPPASSTWDFVTNCAGCPSTPEIASSNGALTATKASAEGNSYIIGTQAISGTIYWEVTVNNDPVNTNFNPSRMLRAGIAHTLSVCNHPHTGLGADSCSAGVWASTDPGTSHPGPIYINFATVADWNATFSTASHLGFVVNTSTGKLWVTNDGTHWYGNSGGFGTDDPCTPTGGLNITAIIADGPIFPAVTVFTTAGGPSADQATYNPTPGSFTFTKPACATAIG